MKLGTLLFSSAVLLTAEASLTPLVTVLNGTYSGIHNVKYGVDSFLGIPYAQPPVGELRYRVAQPMNASWTGVRTASDYGNQCVGYGDDTYLTPYPMSEDCLTLNVVRPAGVGVNASLPVAVWIHGGNYVQGSSANPKYNLSFIVQNSVENNHPIMGVSINYRLQSWGFLFSQEIKDAKVANLGLRDQRAALVWVQENIASFGGDPSKVTIFGESAGAESVGSQLIAYNGRDDGLFRAAIAQSGASIGWGPYPTEDALQTVYEAVTAAAGCGNATDTLDCLRGVPFETLNDVFNSSVSGALQMPIIDGDFIMQSPTTQLLAGQFLKVPFLLGTNTDEGTSFAVQGINTDAEFIDYLQRFATNTTTTSTLQALYPNIPAIGIPASYMTAPDTDLGLQFKRVASLNGDALMHAPRRFTNQIWAKNNLSSYSYRFNVIPNGAAVWAGVGHGQEIAFMMNNIEGVGYVAQGGVDPFEGKPESYKEVAKLMSSMWVSFIWGLNPNIGSSGHSPAWPVYEELPGRAGQNFVFDANVTALTYVEDDTFNAVGINYFSENFVGLFGH